MSKIIHKIEEKIKQKMEGGIHLNNKEEEHKHDDQSKHRGHGQHVKEMMHKIKMKIGQRRRGKKGKSKGRSNRGEEHKEGEKEEDKEEESESDSGGSD